MYTKTYFDKTNIIEARQDKKVSVLKEKFLTYSLFLYKNIATFSSIGMQSKKSSAEEDDECPAECNWQLCCLREWNSPPVAD